ncbi:MAG: hypothetical protein ACI9KE_006370, partial [Polyangiales bacterium]
FSVRNVLSLDLRVPRVLIPTQDSMVCVFELAFAVESLRIHE